MQLQSEKKRGKSSQERTGVFSSKLLTGLDLCFTAYRAHRLFFLKQNKKLFLKEEGKKMQPRIRAESLVKYIQGISYSQYRSDLDLLLQ